MLKNTTSYALLVVLVVLSGAAMAYEEPDFAVVATVDGVEYRQYRPYLVAQTVVAGEADRDRAANIGFRRLFDYISGENATQTEVSMTVPVQQRPVSTRIAMTTPVRQFAGSRGWTLAFIVPGEFDESTVPRPTNPEVHIRAVPEALMAVLRFSGRWTDSNIDAHKSELVSRLSAAGVTPAGEMVTAFYNAPFSLPFMRRNEVMTRIDQLPAAEVPD